MFLKSLDDRQEEEQVTRSKRAHFLLPPPAGEATACSSMPPLKKPLRLWRPCTAGTCGLTSSVASRRAEYQSTGCLCLAVQSRKGSCMKVAWLCKEDGISKTNGSKPAPCSEDMPCAEQDGDDPGRAKKPARSRSPRKDAKS